MATTTITRYSITTLTPTITLSSMSRITPGRPPNLFLEPSTLSTSTSTSPKYNIRSVAFSVLPEELKDPKLPRPSRSPRSTYADVSMPALLERISSDDPAAFNDPHAHSAAITSLRGQTLPRDSGTTSHVDTPASWSDPHHNEVTNPLHLALHQRRDDGYSHKWLTMAYVSLGLVAGAILIVYAAYVVQCVRSRRRMKEGSGLVPYPVMSVPTGVTGGEGKEGTNEVKKNVV